MAMAESNAQISKEMYESGKVHESLMAMKMVCYHYTLCRIHAMLTFDRTPGQGLKQQVL